MQMGSSRILAKKAGLFRHLKIAITSPVAVATQQVT